MNVNVKLLYMHMSAFSDEKMYLNRKRERERVKGCYVYCYYYIFSFRLVKLCKF